MLTPQPSVWRSVENPSLTELNLRKEAICRLTTNHEWRSLSPDRLNCWNQGLGWFAGGICRVIARNLDIPEEIGWIRAANRACSGLKPEDVDLILATGSPFVAFGLAKELSGKLGRPYVLDYRDPWTENLHTPQRNRQITIEEEARLVKNAAAVTIVSRSWAEALDRRFKLGPKLQVITNGYEPETLTSVAPHDFGHFAIVYTGTFYPPKRVIEPVMAALQKLEATIDGKRNPWYFHYYGDGDQHVKEEAKRFGVTLRVVLHGRVPRGEALSALRGARVAVIIATVTQEDPLSDRGMVPAKLYEAMGLKVPVLLIAPPGNDAGAIVGRMASSASYVGSDVEGITGFLQRMIMNEI
ncbi:MAG: glycosyltransferase, partial [Pyrinomonadaceae bacterium]